MPHARFRGTSQAGVRGDVIQEFDWSVGEVMAALDRLKLADNTLVIVTSDNGGVLDANGPDSVNSGTVETNNGHPHNGPLRGGKGSPYEGGTRVPFIARWPGHVKPGTSDELICHVDMLATFAALTGQKLAADAGPDSFNVLPALLGEKLDKPCREHLVEHGNVLALRKGPWKLIPPARRRQGQARQRPRAGGRRTLQPGRRHRRNEEPRRAASGDREGNDRTAAANPREGPQPAVTWKGKTRAHVRCAASISCQPASQWLSTGATASCGVQL